MKSIISSISNNSATNTTIIKNNTRNKTNKSSASPTSTIFTSTDNDSNQAAKLLIRLLSGTSSKSVETATTTATATIPTSTSTPATTNLDQSDHVALRNLETWQDEDGKQLDESNFEELIDSGNSKGWSADEMFKYNERMHKITSNYNEKTHTNNYTTPLPKINSKATLQIVSKLAKEIEDRVIAEGRVTPESSDDDELFEFERMRKAHLRQQRQLDQLKELQQRHSFQQHNIRSNYVNANEKGLGNNNIVKASNKTTKSSSQYSKSTETPATASLSSSPTINDIIIKPVTSSSRNILRTCLT